jgi:hypothetical protein
MVRCVRRHRASMWVGSVCSVGTLADMRGGCNRGGAEARCGGGILPAHVWPTEFHAGSAAGLDTVISGRSNAGDTGVSGVGETVSDGSGGAGGQVRR